MNRSIFLGIVASEFHQETCKDGTRSLSFFLQTSRRYKDRRTGEYRRRDDNFMVKFFGKPVSRLVAVAGSGKGAKLLVEGRMVSRHHDVQMDGKKQTLHSSFVAGDNFWLLSSPPSQGEDIPF